MWETPGIALAAATLLVAASSGRAESASWRGAGKVATAPLRYVRGRVLDLLDVFELHVGMGRGVKADVKYGLHFFGLGDVRAWRAGMFGRRAGTWREIDTEIGLLPVSVLAWPVHYGAKAAGWGRLAGDARFVAQAGSEGVQHLDRKELNGDPEFFWKDTVEGPRHTRWGDSFPIGAEVHAFVGVRAMVRPLQAVDFVVGLVGLDLDPWLARRPF